MKRTAQGEGEHSKITTQPARSPQPRRTVAPAVRPTQLAAMMNGSPRMHALAQMKSDSRQSPHVQNLMRLAAEINQGVPTQLCSLPVNGDAGPECEAEVTGAPNSRSEASAVSVALEENAAQRRSDVPVHGDTGPGQQADVTRTKASAAGNGMGIIQMNRVEAINEEAQLTGIVESMQSRATGAAVDMLFDFSEFDGELEYYFATNEQPDEQERFGLMSLKAPPGIKEGENQEHDQPEIAQSIWVEGLVADSDGGGLGGLLLEKAELLAAEREKISVALAAYEYDPHDREEDAPPYSVVGYYAKKGFTYSGEAYEEVDDSDGDGDGPKSYFYPIYHKKIVD
ncbi:MAG: hypothetical protein LAP21_19590 [Acidobacteriia bacterium]|nr:hypothetical protein [Terriglobia bacterium]